MYAYIAGPLYNEGERWFDEIIDKCARDAGIDTYLPHRDLGIMGSPDDSKKIFDGDLHHLDKADIVIANLNGITVDAGTAWELGYAYARGKYIIGIHTDERVHVRHSVVNLMVFNSCNAFVFSIDELRNAIRKYCAL